MKRHYFTIYKSPKIKVVEVKFDNIICSSPTAEMPDGENGGEL